MKEQLLFMKPYCREVLWGGDRLRTLYGYETPSARTGEAWVVSAVGEAVLSASDNRAPHPFPGESVVSGGAYDGQPLSKVYKEHRELFGGTSSDTFPLLIKLIDAADDLSVQVHPDDAYAQKNEGEPFGKNECWLILQAEEGADIVVGHTAKDKETLRALAQNGEWDRLLSVQPVKEGDFFDIPAGTVHAIRKNTLILEVQQTSNLTYRLYDYDRLQDGKKRPLHLEKALDVITCPQEVHPLREELPGPDGPFAVSRTLLENNLFQIEEWRIPMASGGCTVFHRSPKFTAFLVLEGEGDVFYGPLSLSPDRSRHIRPGDVFLATAFCDSLRFLGAFRLVTATIP